MQAGDVVEVYFGAPTNEEMSLLRPAVIVTSSEILQRNPRTLQVVPLNTDVRPQLPHELPLESWSEPASAQCHLITTIDRNLLTGRSLGQLDFADLRRVRELISDILDIGEI